VPSITFGEEAGLDDQLLSIEQQRSHFAAKPAMKWCAARQSLQRRNRSRHHDNYRNNARKTVFARNDGGARMESCRDARRNGRGLRVRVFVEDICAARVCQEFLLSKRTHTRSSPSEISGLDADARSRATLSLGKDK